MDGQLPPDSRRAMGKLDREATSLRKDAAIRHSRSIWILGIALVSLTLLWGPVPAFAQSCSLCYTQAASSGTRMIQALRSGILVLIFPPTLGTIGMIFVVYHKRNQVRRTDLGEDSVQGW
jgi:hypothetical protein